MYILKNVSCRACEKRQDCLKTHSRPQWKEGAALLAMYCGPNAAVLGAAHCLWSARFSSLCVNLAHVNVRWSARFSSLCRLNLFCGFAMPTSFKPPALIHDLALFRPIILETDSAMRPTVNSTMSVWHFCGVRVAPLRRMPLFLGKRDGFVHPPSSEPVVVPEVRRRASCRLPNWHHGTSYQHEDSTKP